MAVFSTIAHLLSHNRCQFFSHFLMVIEQFSLFIAQCCLYNWFKVLSTHVTLLQSLVSQLIGKKTSNQLKAHKAIFSFFTINKGIKGKVEILLNSNKTIHFIHNSFMFSSKLPKFQYIHTHIRLNHNGSFFSFKRIGFSGSF